MEIDKITNKLNMVAGMLTVEAMRNSLIRQALDKILEVGIELDDLAMELEDQELEQQQRKWVSVKKILPKDDDVILVWVGTTCVRACIGKTPYGPAWYLVDEGSYINLWQVTHWMPIPSAPKGEE